MLTRTIDAMDVAPDHPELFGRRVLVTGVAGPLGLEVARVAAEQQVRLVLLAPEASEETDALAEIVSPLALEVRLFAGPFADAESAVRAARSAMASFGGLDAVVNIAHAQEPTDSSTEAVESAVAGTLSLALLVTRIAANRMRTTLTAGAIVNVLAVPRGASGRTRMVASIARSALAALTRREALEWAPHGIRISAVAQDATGLPGSAPPVGAADVASLALRLVSDRSEQLSGLMHEGLGA